jgi:hypothetical protein
VGIDAFLAKFGDTDTDTDTDTYTPATRLYSYYFYDNSIELRYDPAAHIYYRVYKCNGKEEVVPQAGVTDTCHIVDKSDALIPWACKMMAQKLLSTAKYDGISAFTVPLSSTDLETWVMAAKSAHRDKLEEAANIGHIAHDWIEQYIKQWIQGTAGSTFTAQPLPVNEQAASACMAAMSWMVRHNIQWLHTEKKIYSNFFEFAGTMDGLCLVDSCDDRQCCKEEFTGRLSVADWKTSNYLYPEYLLQTAAYMYAYMEEHGVKITDRWVIRLGKEDGKFEPWHLYGDDYNEDLAAFIAALELSQSMQKVRTRMKARDTEAKNAARARKKEATQKALTLKCKGADTYKGVRAPRCNGGNPCQSCTDKYAQQQRTKETN